MDDIDHNADPVIGLAGQARKKGAGASRLNIPTHQIRAFGDRE